MPLSSVDIFIEIQYLIPGQISFFREEFLLLLFNLSFLFFLYFVKVDFNPEEKMMIKEDKLDL